jgi:phage gp36-like protein
MYSRIRFTPLESWLIFLREKRCSIARYKLSTVRQKYVAYTAETIILADFYLLFRQTFLSFV